MKLTPFVIVLVAVALSNWGCSSSRAPSARPSGPVSQAELAEVAEGDPSSTARRSAVLRLTDQTALAYVATRESDPEVRGQAVLRLTSQPTLTTIALHDADPGVRRCAACRISDQEFLYKMAMDDTSYDVRMFVVEKVIKDQRLLEKLSREHREFSARGLAASKVKDQTALTQIALTDDIAWVRLCAMARLTEQRQLERLLLEGKDLDVREYAVYAVTNPDVLARVAREDSEPWVRLIAVDRLSDRGVLAAAAKDDPCAWVRQAAVENLLGPPAQQPVDRSKVDCVVQEVDHVRHIYKTEMLREKQVAKIVVNSGGGFAVDMTAMYRSGNFLFGDGITEYVCKSSPSGDGRMVTAAMMDYRPDCADNTPLSRAGVVAINGAGVVESAGLKSGWVNMTKEIAVRDVKPRTIRLEGISFWVAPGGARWKSFRVRHVELAYDDKVADLPVTLRLEGPEPDLRLVLKVGNRYELRPVLKALDDLVFEVNVLHSAGTQPATSTHQATPATRP